MEEPCSASSFDRWLLLEPKSNCPILSHTSTRAVVRGEYGGVQVLDEGTGALHREFRLCELSAVTALATFLSAPADRGGQQPRLVAG
jgi:redox-sensitive bicupin YhaK (pirin superfamily)